MLLKFVGQISSLMPLRMLEVFSKQKLYCPFYHALAGDKSLPHIKHLYQLRTVEQFRNDLEYLLKTHQAIGLSDIRDHISGNKPITNKSFFVSFDDGLREVYDYAFPIMQSLGVPATTFLNSDFVDNKGLFYGYKASLIVDAIASGTLSHTTLATAYKTTQTENPESLQHYVLSLRYADQPILNKLANLFEINFEEFLHHEKPYMTSEQISTMCNSGYTFGGHSIDHPHFDDIDLNEQLRQAAISTKHASRLTNADITSFAFPFSDAYVSEHFFEQNSAHTFADIIFGTQGYKLDMDARIVHRHWLEGSSESTAKFIKLEHAKSALNRLRGADRVVRPKNELRGAVN